jgi:hypothetical protein
MSARRMILTGCALGCGGSLIFSEFPNNRLDLFPIIRNS